MKKLVCLAALIFALWASFSASQEISTIYTGVSVRAQSALSNRQIANCEKYAQENAVVLSFWREESIAVTNKLNTEGAAAVFFKGSASAAFGAIYISGSAPFSADSAACAISQELSHKLYGTDKVIGLALYTDAREYTIRGVFKGRGQSEILLCADSGFNTVELFGEYSATDIDSFITLCGLAGSDIVYAQSIAGFFEFLKLMPCFTALIFTAQALLKLSKGLTPITRECILFAAVFILAALLVYMLKGLPPWLLPPKLSSAQAWGQIFSGLWDKLLLYLSITPAVKDTAARLLIFKCTAFSLLAAVFTAKLYKESGTVHNCRAQPAY